MDNPNKAFKRKHLRDLLEVRLECGMCGRIRYVTMAQWRHPDWVIECACLETMAWRAV